MENDFDLSDTPCTVCGELLTIGRVKYGKTNKCLDCSDTKKVGAFPIISGKSEYSQIQITTPEIAEKLHRAQYRRGQSPGSAMKGSSKLH